MSPGDKRPDRIALVFNWLRTTGARLNSSSLANTCWLMEWDSWVASCKVERLALK